MSRPVRSFPAFRGSAMILPFCGCTVALAVVSGVLPGLGPPQARAADPVWMNRAVAGPSPRWHHAMVYDTLREVSVLFGGGDPWENDTWEWNGVAWAHRSDTGPSPRIGSRMAFDQQRGVTVLFGGWDSGGPNGETWEWDGTAWTHRITGNAPSPRYEHAMAYDSTRGVTVLFGGTRDFLGGDINNETWLWDGGAWTQLFPADSPSPRYLHAMAFDSLRGVVVLFGGRTQFQGGESAETWEWNGTTWTQRSVPGPSARGQSSMSFDSARGATVLFGGVTCAHSSCALGDTWEWNGSMWTQWFPTPSPTARYLSATAYDVARNATVLFGGIGTSGSESETWEYGLDCNGNSMPDADDITGTTSTDCNANGAPDECDIAADTSQDCNTNGNPDECDVSSGLVISTPVCMFGADQIHAAVFSPDGSTVLTGGHDMAARLWDVATCQELAPLFSGPGGHGDRVIDLTFSVDGALVLTAGATDNTARLWDAGSRALLRTFNHGNAVWGVALSPDHSLVLTGGYGTGTTATCLLWDAETGDVIRPIEAHGVSVNDVVFSADGAAVLTASSDGTAKLSSVTTGQPFRVFNGHAGPVNKAVFSPDESHVLTTSNDTTARLWNAMNGAEVRQFPHPDRVQGADFTSDGRLVATGCRDGRIRVWRVETGELVRTLLGPFLGDCTAVTVDYSPDGSSLVSAHTTAHCVGGENARVWQPMVSADCNANGVPDECDVAGGRSADCNTNSVPDECELDFDGDALIDACDDDIDNDGVPNDPDVCDYTPIGLPREYIEPDGSVKGDLDGDCDVDLEDFAMMQARFTGPNP